MIDRRDEGAAMYTTIWEYTVDPEHQAEFLQLYGSAGAWVALFSRTVGFQETVLLRDVSRPERYVTLDRWESREAYEAFRTAERAAYAALDARTAGLTRSERHLGALES
jgi:heme-degrading monooxygenase HmoA